MKYFSGVFYFVFLVVFSACQQPAKNMKSIEELLENGDFLLAEDLLKTKIVKEKINPELKESLQIQLENITRLRKEFSYSRPEIKEQIKEYYPEITDEQLDKWEEAKQLEMRVIDGEKRYFNRSASNFFRLNAEAKALKESVNGKIYSGVGDFQQTVIPAWFEKGIVPATAFGSGKIKVNYTVKLKANQVPEGEIVKCWLPYPRTGSPRLSNVEFLGASQDEYLIAPNETMQRTVYMEKPAVKNEETVFNVSFIFEPAAQWFDVKPMQARPYDKTSEFYKKYTAEQLPHIVFSEEIKTLANEIVGKEINPVKQVELLYYWINQNIPWAGALEYSVMPCIPAYVLENRHGDCGMQTFLFLSMARSLGIPCKWQSGWYLLPQTKNLHDWAEVYYQGIGWVPVDPSFGLIDSEDKRVKEFYLNGLDNYRLVVNDDFAQELYPPKKYYRSEPYDFQRGELEWEGGNLYFDTWSYHMEVEYLD